MSTENSGRTLFVRNALLLGGLFGLVFGLTGLFMPEPLEPAVIIIMAVFGALSVPLSGFFALGLFAPIALILFISDLQIITLSWPMMLLRATLIAALFGLAAASWLNARRRCSPLWSTARSWTLFFPATGAAAFWTLALLPDPSYGRQALRRAWALIAVLSLTCAWLQWRGWDGMQKSSARRLQALKTQLERP